MKQQTIFDVLLDLTLAELPPEHHNAWRSALLWDCVTQSPENLTRVCSPAFKQYLIDTDAGKELFANIQAALANGDSSFFDDTPEDFRVVFVMGSPLAVVNTPNGLEFQKVIRSTRHAHS